MKVKTKKLYLGLQGLLLRWSHILKFKKRKKNFKIQQIEKFEKKESEILLEALGHCLLFEAPDDLGECAGRGAP